MRKVITVVFWCVILFAVPVVVWGQESSVDQALYYDLKNTFVAVLMVLLVVVTLLGGGLLRLLSTIANNPTILQAAERGYDNARKDTQDLVKMLHTSLAMAERLALQVAPTSVVTKQIESAEDILEEITDGEPYRLSPAQAADILYRPTPSPLDNIQKGDSPEMDKS